jgi:hypothetical protein
VLGAIYDDGILLWYHEWDNGVVLEGYIPVSDASVFRGTGYGAACTGNGIFVYRIDMDHE